MNNYALSFKSFDLDNLLNAGKSVLLSRDRSAYQLILQETSSPYRLAPYTYLAVQDTLGVYCDNFLQDRTLVSLCLKTIPFL